MNDAGYIKKYAEQNVDDKVLSCSAFQEYSDRRQEYCQDNKEKFVHVPPLGVDRDTDKFYMEIPIMVIPPIR